MYISHGVPSKASFFQLLGLCQDRNAHLLTNSIDWIPFGSSFIIGRTKIDLAQLCTSVTEIHTTATEVC